MAFDSFRFVYLLATPLSERYAFHLYSFRLIILINLLLSYIFVVRFIKTIFSWLHIIQLSDFLSFQPFLHLALSCLSSFSDFQMSLMLEVNKLAHLEFYLAVFLDGLTTYFRIFVLAFKSFQSH